MNDLTEKPIQQTRIVFTQKDFMKTFRQITTIQILTESNITMYYFGTKQGTSFYQQSSSSTPTQTPLPLPSQSPPTAPPTPTPPKPKKQRKCQYLYLLRFNLDTTPNEPAQPVVSIIDHVFEVGIFNKSKIYQSGPSIFLISLYEEIIVVKYHFQNYVVWDNISLAASKSIERKGQLVLADKIVMVYTEMADIYAHNIFFSFKESKLKYPRIDNFKVVDNDQQSILYDALILQYAPGSFMKVLIYFKQAEVYTPNHKVMIYKQDKVMSQLTCGIRCIQQNDPLIKLAQLFRLKKPPNQISQFIQRFSITQLDKSKCQWSVSQKNQKDIQNLLLQIKQNQYIQNELTQILKSNPHDLKFLIKIQKKQIERYKRMLATKMLKNDQDADPEMLALLYRETKSYFTRGEVEDIKQIIKWVMEAIMFDKKLAYSKNFLEFMEYQFIDIGKLKAASLKEEIKLLSCKGYEKRLQYFLNSFKYMILANFENIFEFLIQDKSVSQIQKFFIQDFPFILPKFQQPSQLFRKKKQKQRQKQLSIRTRKQSFAPINALQLQFLTKFQPQPQTQQKQQQKCQLWQDKFNDQSQIKKIQTKQSFKRYIDTEIENTRASIQSVREHEEKRNNNAVFKECLRIEDAQREFQRILGEFMREPWFLENKSKQHSIIQLTIEQLRDKVQYLKRIGVFHLLIKFFYTKIQNQQYKQSQVDRALQNFKSKELIPQSFQQNIIARRQIHKKITENPRPNTDLPLLPQFLIYEQTQYFDYLFQHYRGMLLKEVKSIYDVVVPGLFKEKFQIYLNSEKIDLAGVIDFLDQFQGNVNDDIRKDVFVCIKKLLQISNKEDTASFVNKLMEKEILKQENSSSSGIDSLIDQAKIAFGYYFYQFFRIFNITQTYKQLIQQTTTQQYDKCQILKKILIMYCKGEYIKNMEHGGGFSSHISHGESSGQGHVHGHANQNEFENQYGVIKFEERFGLEQLEFVIEGQPMEFFGIVLYLIDTLRFQIKPYIIFDKFVELLLEQQSYDNLVKFIEDFRQKIGGQFANSQFQYHDDNSQQFKQRNYQLLRQFYQSNGDGITVQDRLSNNIIIWTRKMYKALSQKIGSSMPRMYIKKFSQNPLNKINMSFQKVLKGLDLQNADIIRERAFLKMLDQVIAIDPKLLSFILKTRFENSNDDNLLNEQSQLLNNVTAFIFMIKLLKAIPQQKFTQINQKLSTTHKTLSQLKKSLTENPPQDQLTLQARTLEYKRLQQYVTKMQSHIKVEIYGFQCIYSKFLSTSKYDYGVGGSRDESQFGLVRFYMELGMRLMEEGNFFYCCKVMEVIINNQYYFRDVFYCFMALINQNRGSPSEQDFTKFINTFIQTSHEQTLKKLFISFIDENQIVQFFGQTPKKQDINQSRQREQIIKVPQMRKQRTTNSITFGTNPTQTPKPKQSPTSPPRSALTNRQKITQALKRKADEQPSPIPYTQTHPRVQQNFDLRLAPQISDFTVVIFECLVRNRRVDEAYYFLVRNQLLSVLQATNLELNGGGSGGSSGVGDGERVGAGYQVYALVSIYMRCLKKFLCEDFYPTFNFYRSKVEALNNSFQRKDIIKDINIAMSRLKQLISTQKLKLTEQQTILQTSINLMTSLVQKKLNLQDDFPTQQTPKQQKPNTQLQKQQINQKIQSMKAYLHSLQQHLNQLTTLYGRYMAMINQDPVLKLDEEESRVKGVGREKDRKGSGAGSAMGSVVSGDQGRDGFGDVRGSGVGDNRNIRVEQLMNRQISQQQKQIQAQKKRLKDNPQILQLQSQLSHQLKQTKLLSQKHQKQLQLSNLKLSKKPPQANTAKLLYKDLKQKQKSDLGSVKESYKSQTAERVNQFLEEMRLRKSKIYEKSSAARSGASRLSEFDGHGAQGYHRHEDIRQREDHRQQGQDRGRKNSDQFSKMKNFAHSLISPPNLMPKNYKEMNRVGSDQHSIGQSRNYQVQVHDIHGQTKDIYMPVTMTEQKNMNSKVSIHKNLHENAPRYQSQLPTHRSNLPKSQVKPSHPHSHSITLPSLLTLFGQQQPHCKKYIQKLQIVKSNLQVGLQLTKNILATVHHFQNFIKYLSYLFEANPSYKEVIEEKAYRIAQQAMGIEYKVNLKELFPGEMFTKVVQVSMKEYYRIAYDVMRPNLMKILARPETNVHGMAILYRFGFGSQNTYYYQVYQDYIKTLLQSYSNESPHSPQAPEKQLFLLSEKLRTLYNNINSQNRQYKFEQLLRSEVQNEGKRQALVREMIRNLDRRTEMLTGERSGDLREVLMRM